MKVKILTSYPKQSFEVNNIYFSSDLHLGHQAIVDYGREFDDVETMNNHIITEINSKVGKDDLLVLLGDTMMGEKNYAEFLDSINCNNVIMLVGNHCNRGKLNKIVEDHQFPKLKYIGDYLELVVQGQIICCSHYPFFHWNYQIDGSFMLHGHLHGDSSEILDLIHQYKSMDVGIDSYYNLFGKYSVFSLEEVRALLYDRKVIDRHSN